MRYNISGYELALCNRILEGVVQRGPLAWIEKLVSLRPQCVMKILDKILQLLVEKCPGAVNKRSTIRLLADRLFQDARDHKPIESVKKLVSLNPECVTEVLDKILRLNPPPEFDLIQLLVIQCPGDLNKKSTVLALAQCLFRYIRDHRPLESVKKLVSLNPDCVKDALHNIIKMNPASDLELIQFLVRQCPEAVNKEPTKIALANRLVRDVQEHKPIESIKKLVSLNPECVTNVLDSILRLKPPPEFQLIQFLMEQYPGDVNQKSTTLALSDCLFEYVLDNKPLKSIKKLVALHPDCVKDALDNIIKMNPASDLELIQLLVEQCPDVVHQKSTIIAFGNRLVKDCKDHKPVESIKKLVSLNPQCVSEVFDNILQLTPPPELKFIYFLVGQFPVDVNKKSTILSLANCLFQYVQDNKRIGSIKKLVSLNPACVAEVLDIILELIPPPNIELIHFCLEQCPGKVKKDSTLVALSWCLFRYVGYNKPIESIIKLVSFNPECVIEVLGDIIMNVPTPDWKLIKVIAQQNPSAVRCRCNDGLLPLHHSCVRGAPFEFINYLINECPIACLMFSKKVCNSEEFYNVEAENMLDLICQIAEKKNLDKTTLDLLTRETLDVAFTFVEAIILLAHERSPVRTTIHRAEKVVNNFLYAEIDDPFYFFQKREDLRSKLTRKVFDRIIRHGHCQDALETEVVQSLMENIIEMNKIKHEFQEQEAMPDQTRMIFAAHPNR